MAQRSCSSNGGQPETLGRHGTVRVSRPGRGWWWWWWGHRDAVGTLGFGAATSAPGLGGTTFGATGAAATGTAGTKFTSQAINDPREQGVQVMHSITVLPNFAGKSFEVRFFFFRMPDRWGERLAADVSLSGTDR